MRMNEPSSSTPQRKASNNVYRSSGVLEPINRSRHHLSQLTFTHRNTLLHLVMEPTEDRPTNLLVVVTDSLKVEWMVMPLLVLQVEIYLLHLVEMLEGILLLLSVVVLHLLRSNSPTSHEVQCLDTHHLHLSKSVNQTPAVSEMRRCTTAVNVIPWAEGLSMPHLRLDVDPNTLLTLRMVKERGSENESAMNGRGEIEPEPLQDPIPVDHLQDFPSTDKVATISLHDYLPILEITLDMARAHQVPLLRSTPPTPDTIPDKVTEWTLEAHLSFEMILELILLLHLLLVELLPRGSRRKTSLGQHPRKLGMRVVNRQARSRQMVMAKVMVLLPTDPLMRVSFQDSSSSASADETDYDDGAGAVDALMTLHGDRPSNSASPSGSPSAGSKRPASPKLDAVQSVKKSKSATGSPATRVVLEVINTPTVDSPIPRTDGASNGDGYFKGVEPKIAEATTTEAAPETSEKTVGSTVESVASETVSAPSAPAPAEETKAPTPPAAPVADTASTEDVTMADVEPTAPAAETAVAPTTADSAPAEAAQSAAETSTIEPTASEPTITETAAPAPAAAKPESSAMEVDAPAESERPATPDLPAPPAATAATTTETPAQPTEDEKKE
jgi:hypothetical protein